LDPANGEECDGPDLGGATCDEISGQDPLGAPICRGNCTLYCTRCGNGIIELRADGEAEECDDGNLTPLDGCSETCTIERCGDGHVQPWERCDDGNSAPGDGCSADCQSDETCGNGVIDYLEGETCDDGNLRSRDGCSSGCTVENPGWSRWVSPLSRGRHDHGMVFDSARARSLIFGGFDGQLQNDTWAYDGDTWHPISVSSFPDARTLHAMTYDTARDRVVMFGGFSDVPLGDTWEFDGVSWSEATTASSPEPRLAHLMVFDSTRQVVVLHGGGGGTSHLQDTWEWNGHTWTQIITAAAPPPRFSAAAAYDATSQRVILFGGRYDEDRDDTWAYDGVSWVSLTPSDSPPATSEHRLVFDEMQGRIVLHGGSRQGIPSNETWAFQAGNWQQLQPSGPIPPARSGHGMVYDSLRGVVVFHAGRCEPLVCADTWELSGNTFREATPLTEPPGRQGHRLVFDETQRTLVLFGGSSLSRTYDDTWAFDGQHWWEIRTSNAPPAREDHAMAWDPQRSEVVLFGGTNQRSAIVYDDTWGLGGDPLDWRVVPVQSRPPPGSGHALAQDPGGQQLLLFGGLWGDFPQRDTWLFKHGDWQMMPHAEQDWPPSLAFTAAVTDSGRCGVLLYGGFEQQLFGTNSLFSFSQGIWRPLTASHHPESRFGHAMTEDASNGWTQVFGGTTNLGSLGDTLILDGSKWKHLLLPVSPSARSEAALAFDRKRRVSVLFGGSTGADETWELAFRSGHPEEDCSDGADNDEDALTDCDDPDCNLDPSCQPVELCDNGDDDDGDDLVDCADPNCGGAPCLDTCRCRAGRCQDTEGHLCE
jgi:cysteine-rich repeat protein